MIREMFEDTPIVSSIIAIAIAGLAFILIDVIASKPEVFYGNVIDKHYKAERTNVGTGTAVGSNGSVGVVTTTEVDPEEFADDMPAFINLCNAVRAAKEARDEQ